jgi:YbgC/YbaW family acyl-CoA thioester hydrolase
MPVTYRTTCRVEFADTDMAGIMHFARFFSMMEEVEHEFLRTRGLSVVMQHEGRNIGFPRVSAKCDFRKPVVFEDVLEAILTLDRLGEKSLTYSVEFRKAGETVAQGSITAVCCLCEPGKITPLEVPADVRRKILGEG